jgi:DNA-directed RNA polymerase subunit M
MVEFCDNCGAIIIGKKGEKVSCQACGTEIVSNTEINISEKIEKKENFEVIDTSQTEEIHPTTPVECPKCGNKEAYYWTKQTRAGDEPETQFFKCVSCSHQWREYK